MKGSGVVQRGLKSFIDKLHPTLPLSSKESNRLLTALKSSFRDHLDEVHPRTAGGGDAKRTDRGLLDRPPSKPDRSQIYSSAAAADTHLSSILTNPLLGAAPARLHSSAVQKQHLQESPAVPRDAWDYANAEMALRKGKSPIDLLEEHHDAGRATVPIAALCLQKFKDSIDRLPEGVRLGMINKVEPGRRTFLWLWTSGLHTSSELFDNRSLINSLVYFLLLEKHEQYLWDWIRFNAGTVESSPISPKPHRETTRMMLDKYQWKGRLLAILTLIKMNPSFNHSKSADAAILVCLTAQELKSSASQRPSHDEHLKLLPIGRPFNAFFHRYYLSPHLFKNTDALLFDKFIDAMTNYSKNPTNAMLIAMLRTVHPSHPTGVPLLDHLRAALDQKTPNTQASHVKEYILARPKVSLTGMVRATVRLEMDGHTDGAAWMKATISELHPAFSTVKLLLEKTRCELENLDRKNAVSAKDESKTEVTSVPLFT